MGFGMLGVSYLPCLFATDMVVFSDNDLLLLTFVMKKPLDLSSLPILSRRTYIMWVYPIHPLRWFPKIICSNSVFIVRKVNNGESKDFEVVESRVFSADFDDSSTVEESFMSPACMPPIEYDFSHHNLRNSNSKFGLLAMRRDYMPLSLFVSDLNQLIQMYDVTKELDQSSHPQGVQCFAHIHGARRLYDTSKISVIYQRNWFLVYPSPISPKSSFWVLSQPQLLLVLYRCYGKLASYCMKFPSVQGSCNVSSSVQGSCKTTICSGSIFGHINIDREFGVDAWVSNGGELWLHVCNFSSTAVMG